MRASAPLWSLLALLAMLGSGCSQPATPVAAARQPEPRFVGSERCAACHSAQAEAWTKSQHHVAMQAASGQSVLAPFGGESLRSHGVTSVFSRRDGNYQVRTAAAEGHLQDVAVAYAFGVAPLQTTPAAYIRLCRNEPWL